MISVLIPTFNYKCYKLVADVQSQFEATGEDYEVIVAEDGGKDQVVAISNHRINELPHCRYIRREKNVGRAAIRNFLAREAKGGWLMFMDSDAEVVRDDFVKAYVSAAKERGADVIVGGLVNPEAIPSPKVTLRYKYEKASEYQRSASYRQRYPYARFTTFNVMMRRGVIDMIPFDEACTDYGYEDALMGIEMMHKNISLLHIDNPLKHAGFENNQIFLRKTEVALNTLIKLGDKMVPYTGIGVVSEKIMRYHLKGLFTLSFGLLKPMVRHNLLGSNPCIKLFNYYKLCYYLSQTRNVYNH